MSYIDDKMEIIDKVVDVLGGKPRAYLKKHLTYSDGTPKYTVIESDRDGPKRITLANRMDGSARVWVRIEKDGRDSLFEGE